jgi:hypothetical protein
MQGFEEVERAADGAFRARDPDLQQLFAKPAGAMFDLQARHEPPVCARGGAAGLDRETAIWPRRRRKPITVLPGWWGAGIGRGVAHLEPASVIRG